MFCRVRDWNKKKRNVYAAQNGAISSLGKTDDQKDRIPTVAALLSCSMIVFVTERCAATQKITLELLRCVVLPM